MTGGAITSSIRCFRAWCSGRSYPRPTAYLALAQHRVVVLQTGRTTLGRFRFRSSRAFATALRIARESVQRVRRQRIAARNAACWRWHRDEIVRSVDLPKKIDLRPGAINVARMHNRCGRCQRWLS